MPPTPEEFAAQARQLAKDYAADEEVQHMAMDGLMRRLLTELGYGEGAKICDENSKWYA